MLFGSMRFPAGAESVPAFNANQHRKFRGGVNPGILTSVLDQTSGRERKLESCREEIGVVSIHSILLKNPGGYFFRLGSGIFT